MDGGLSVYIEVVIISVVFFYGRLFHFENGMIHIGGL